MIGLQKTSPHPGPRRYVWGFPTTLTRSRLDGTTLSRSRGRGTSIRWSGEGELSAVTLKFLRQWIAERISDYSECPIDVPSPVLTGEGQGEGFFEK